MRPQLTFGPYFTSGHKVPELGKGTIQPLGLLCEWASPTTTSRIDLFRYQSSHAPTLCRLEHLLFPSEQLPFSLRCQSFQVVQSAGTTYLPLEALLLQLYRRCKVPQHIFAALAELASLVPLHSSVSRPITQTGLLVAPAEAQGFRLNTVLRHDGEIFAEIAWEPNAQACRFHVCICRFPDRKPDTGTWQPSGLLGVSRLLAQALRQLVGGPPVAVFTPAGEQFLWTQPARPARQT
ncbi:MAG TPA: hypothetical protein VG206_13835 [Terriglobia bacterium]|nr:hypothetical protein [Terriglobia bacterium]